MNLTNIIQNEILLAQIHPKGAELQSLKRQDNGVEYMWNGDPAYWAKHSPILFPIVGTLKNDTYFYKEHSYHLPRHGFARDKTFQVESSISNEIVFLLKDDEETRKIYPFAFELRLHYKLEGATLVVSYSVFNPSQTSIYFSIGGHPAFAVPFVPGTSYSDYYLEFEKQENGGRWAIESGLLKNEPEPFFRNDRRIQLSEELFARDAIVLKNLDSNSVSLKTDKSNTSLRFDFTGWPDLGIWAAPRAPFVCIEPWCGHADYVSHNQQLIEKAGIITLEANRRWEKAWKVAIEL